MTHPDCSHLCSGNCRRIGCNCLCGEFHDTLSQEELDEIQEDTTSMEEKLEALNKLNISSPDKKGKDGKP
mgnify:CR=1 FL=1